METNQLSNSLTELALDRRWAWNHAADELWRQLDPEVWELTGNAWFVLQTVSKQRLQAARFESRIPTHTRRIGRGEAPTHRGSALVPADLP